MIIRDMDHIIFLKANYTNLPTEDMDDRHPHIMNTTYTFQMIFMQVYEFISLLCEVWIAQKHNINHITYGTCQIVIHIYLIIKNRKHTAT